MGYVQRTDWRLRPPGCHRRDVPHVTLQDRSQVPTRTVSCSSSRTTTIPSVSHRRPSTMTCARAFFIASLVFSSALGSLYPTSPVAGTVYDAGRQNLVEWIDDDPTPHLYEISVLKIDLYHDNDVCLSGLSWLLHWLTRPPGALWHVSDWR